MTKSIFMDNYPICSVTLSKKECAFSSVDTILEFFKQKIESHPKGAFISIFDHYNHTQGLGGEINESIKDAKMIIFCFGPIIPNPKALALRPRSFGVCELDESFSIDFMQAPNETIQNILETWIEDLKAAK